MSMDAIARGLANKAQTAIANGNLPYAMSTGFSAGTVGRKLQETLSARDFGAKGDGRIVFNGAMTAGSATLAVSLSGFSGFVAGDVGKVITVPGGGAAGVSLVTTIAAIVSASSVTLATSAVTTVTGQQVTFGTNDTAALQAMLDYVTVNRRQAFLPDGIYCVTGALNSQARPGWGLSGNGPECTILVQMNDNVPLLDLGSVAGSLLHTFLLQDFKLSFAALQPSANSNASCMVFSTMAYWGTLRRIYFERGCDGIKVRSGIGGPWGQNWDDFRFLSTLSGSAMDWTGAINGVPNNRWGRMVVEMNAMAKPVFNQVRGYNWSIESIEMLSAVGANSGGGTGQQLFNLQSASTVDINCLKLEALNYTGTHAFAGNALIYAPSGGVRIRQLFFGGVQSVFNTTNALFIFSGAVREFQVEYLYTSLSQAPANIAVSAASTGRVVVGNLDDTNAAGVIPLTNIGSSVSANVTTYGRNAIRRLSDDIGNADYTLATNGGPTVIVAQTALTLPRSIEIMADTNYLFNGYTVTVLSRGAVNGTNTLTIKAGGNTKATISSDNYAIELTWRRAPTAHSGWVVTRQGAA